MIIWLNCTTITVKKLSTLI